MKKEKKTKVVCPIPHKTCALIIEKLTNPEYLTRGQDWAAELKIFKSFVVKTPYLDEKFWLDFNPGFQVKSILWWFNGGKEDLEKAWRFYCLLNKTSKNNNDENKVDNNIDLNNVVVPKAKPASLLEWLK